MEHTLQNSVANLENYYPARPSEVAKYVIFANGSGKSILLVFDNQTGLPTHVAPADATVQILEGEVEFELDNLKMRLHRGDIVTMHKGTPHSVSAPQGARILLTLFG